MIADEYLDRSRLFRRLRNEPYGSYVELYASRLVKVGLSRHGTWRSLNLLGDLMNWLTRIGSMLTELNVVTGRWPRRSALRRPKCLRFGEIFGCLSELVRSARDDSPRRVVKRKPVANHKRQPPENSMSRGECPPAMTQKRLQGRAI
jgi:hypothetical protein